jgi:membrane fusion protein (multidrug efflux system)
VEVRVASHPDQVFRAEVHVVSPTIDPGDARAAWKALLPNPDGRLLPGALPGRPRVADRDGVVMVPKEAVLQRADGSVLFRLATPERVERVKVETGIFRDDLVEVRGGVAAGDWIVVRGQTGLVDGSPVSLHDENGKPVDAATLGMPAQAAGGEG